MAPKGWPTIEELQQRTAEYQQYSTMTPDDLPADLKTEAEHLASEFVDGLDREHLLRQRNELRRTTSSRL